MLDDFTCQGESAGTQWVNYVKGGLVRFRIFLKLKFSNPLNDPPTHTHILTHSHFLFDMQKFQILNFVQTPQAREYCKETFILLHRAIEHDI
jgi:hypothetical protein